MVILIIGWIIAAVLSSLANRGLHFADARGWFDKAGIKDEKVQDTWINVLTQLVFWAVLILFLIPVFETWNIPQITEVINQLLLYLPQVFAAVIIGFLGLVIANLLADIVKNAVRSYGQGAANIVSSIARYSIITFTALVVLTQLGIAPDLIQTIVTGIVVAFALATGLAFGLGGQDAARQLLNQLMENMKKKK